MSTAVGPVSSINKTWISGAKTTTFQSDDQGIDRFSAVRVFLNITAVSGTSPTLDVYVQTLMPDNVTWADIAHFPQATGTTKLCVDLVNQGSNFVTVQSAALAASTIVACLLGRRIRLNCVIGGTNPSFTVAAALMMWG